MLKLIVLVVFLIIGIGKWWEKLLGDEEGVFGLKL